MIVSIYIDNERLDLFGEEAINLVSSVLDIQDITKNTTEFTKVFTVPASNNNNRIFKHYYNANIDNTFDARVSVDARIDISGIVFRTGKVILQRVEVKNQLAYAYMINFTGDLLALKELFGADYLSDVDFSTYDETYSPAWIKSLLIETSESAPLRVPLLSKRRYYYNSDIADETQTETETNIAYTGAGTLNGINYDDLNPAIKLKIVIDAIADHYGITFMSTLFDSVNFGKLFLYLDNGDSNNVSSEEVEVDFDAKDGGNTFTNLTTNITTVERLASDTITVFSLSCLSLITTDYTVKVYDNDVLVSQTTGSGNQFTVYSAFGIGISNVRFSVSAGYEEMGFTTTLGIDRFIGGNPPLSNLATSSIQTSTPSFSVALNMPKIKVIDFFKGLIQAFKLVVIPSGTDVFIDTIVNYYAAGDLIDLTKYIDFEKVDIARGDVLNTISYKFKKAKTLLAKTYEEINRKGYGDEEYLLKDDYGKLLDGTKQEIKLPFEQIIYERLNDIDTGNVTTVQYGGLIKDTFKTIHPEAHIMYLVSRDVSANTVGFFDTSKHELDTINIPSHTMSDSDFGTAFLFSAEFDEYFGQSLTDNLYTQYHQSYINQLFDIKKRSYVFKAKNIPLSTLSSIELNDVIKIKNNYYRIDKFTTNLITNGVLFDLFNIQELDISL